MLKTNSKIVRERIKNYIIDNFSFENYKNEGIVEPKTFHEIANFIWDSFMDCQSEHDLYCKNRQELFSDWCCGLPSILDTTPYHYLGSAVDLLGNILEETESEKARFDEMDAVRLMDYLIYREIIKEVRK